MPVEANSSHGLAVLLIVGLAHVANAQVRGIYRATLAEINEKTQEVSTEQVRRILADGSAIVLDSRKGSEYVASHIPGARNIDAQPANRLRLLNTLFQRIRNPKRSFALMRNPDVLRLENNELFYRHVTCVLGG